MVEKLWHWLTCEGRTLTLQHEEEYPEGYQAGDEHMCGLSQYSLYSTCEAAQNWDDEIASTLSDLKLMRGIACPCVWQSCIKGEHIVATVHGDDITIGGGRSAVELCIKMTSRKIRDQETGDR